MLPESGSYLWGTPGTTATKKYSLNIVTRLQDGTRLLVRTLRPSDREDLLAGFARLSFASRRFRFLSPIRKLTAAQARDLTEVDQLNHVAIAARELGRAGKPGIGVARFVRTEQDPAVAEFAITVIDDYQNRGLGTLLLQLLLAAAPMVGLSTLRGFVLADNTRMLRLLEKFGASFLRAADGTLVADVPVPGVAFPAPSP